MASLEIGAFSMFANMALHRTAVGQSIMLFGTLPNIARINLLPRLSKSASRLVVLTSLVGTLTASVKAVEIALGFH